MKVLKNNRGIKLALEAKPSSIYSILSLVMWIGLFAFVIFLLQYFNNYVKMGVAIFVPMIILVFLSKVVIWNFFGTEFLDIGKKTLQVTYRYRFLYPDFVHTYQLTNTDISLKTNTDKELINLMDFDQFKKAKWYKIHLNTVDKKAYISSKNITYDEVLLLKQKMS